jgi:hypothetical protein
MSSNNTHGGPRPGSGRKPSPDKKIAITVRVHPELRAYLASCENQAAAIESALRASPGYLAWSRQTVTARAKPRQKNVTPASRSTKKPPKSQ